MTETAGERISEFFNDGRGMWRRVIGLSQPDIRLNDTWTPCLSTDCAICTVSTKLSRLCTVVWMTEIENVLTSVVVSRLNASRGKEISFKTMQKTLHVDGCLYFKGCPTQGMVRKHLTKKILKCGSC